MKDAGPIDTGLYVHVPYCRHRCPYCDFNVWVDPRAPWGELARAVAREIRTRSSVFPGQFRTIYFGGGTPSLAPPPFFESILQAARETLGVSQAAEITVEIEPGTVDVEGLRKLVELGANRASLGWQSTHDTLLRQLGRGHSANDSAKMATSAKNAGFESLSVDLIFAVPGQSMDELERDLDAIIELGSDHVSLYALTFEANTDFDRRRRSGLLAPVDDEMELAMMERIAMRLEAAGFCHYEVSNYAKPGSEARHNSGYWSGHPYLGVGPGAESYLPNARGATRWQVVKNPGVYIDAWSKGLEHGKKATEWQEQLNHRQVLTERFMTAMRLEAGIDTALLNLDQFADELERAAALAESKGWLKKSGTVWRPTASGRRFADSLAALFAS